MVRLVIMIRVSDCDFGFRISPAKTISHSTTTWPNDKRVTRITLTITNVPLATCESRAGKSIRILNRQSRITNEISINESGVASDFRQLTDSRIQTGHHTTHPHTHAEVTRNTSLSFRLVSCESWTITNAAAAVSECRAKLAVHFWSSKQIGSRFPLSPFTSDASVGIPEPQNG